MGDVLIFDPNVVASQGSPQIRLIHSTLLTMAIPLAAGAVWAFPLIFSGFIGKDFRWISKTLLEQRKLIASNINVRSLILQHQGIFLRANLDELLPVCSFTFFHLYPA